MLDGLASRTSTPGRRRIEGTWVLNFVMLIGLLWAPEAEACRWGWTETDDVLGVGPDGWFVVRNERDNEAAVTKRVTLTVRDTEGFSVASYGATTGETDDHSVQFTGDHQRLAAIGSPGRVTTIEVVQQDLIEALSLTALRPSSQQVRAGAARGAFQCGPVELDTPDGWVPVLRQGGIAEGENECEPTRVGAFDHPTSPLLFVHGRVVVGHEPTDQDLDTVGWVGPARIRGARAIARGRELARRGKDTHALTEIRLALREAPEILDSRLLLLQIGTRLGLPLVHLVDDIAWYSADSDPCLSFGNADLDAWASRQERHWPADMDRFLNSGPRPPNYCMSAGAFLGPTPGARPRLDFPWGTPASIDTDNDGDDGEEESEHGNPVRTTSFNKWFLVSSSQNLGRDGSENAWAPAAREWRDPVTIAPSTLFTATEILGRGLVAFPILLGFGFLLGRIRRTPRSPRSAHPYR